MLSVLNISTAMDQLARLEDVFFNAKTMQFLPSINLYCFKVAIYTIMEESLFGLLECAIVLL